VPLNLTRVRTVLLDVPKHAKLAYCLLRDERVPAAPKAVLIGALGVVVSPLDLPAWIPVLGELDILALSILAVKVFVDACPDELVAEHRAALKRGDSVFDEDFRAASAAARELALGAVGRLRTGVLNRLRPRLRALPDLEDQTA
jgi:uncharacterized membrane protein YkvA (DUF1232 family)